MANSGQKTSSDNGDSTGEGRRWRILLAGIMMTLGALVTATLRWWVARIHDPHCDLLPADVVTVALLVIAALPWAGLFLSAAKVPGVGEFSFRQMNERLDGAMMFINRLAVGQGEGASQEPEQTRTVTAKVFDPNRVIDWAREHKANNAYDMGPKNFERCLFDLGYAGGQAHELEYDDNGALRYK